MPFEPGVRGYLLIRVEEASGKTQKDLFTWDTSSSAFEAFVKVELRGGVRNTKAQTSKAPLIGDTVTWRETVKLEVLDQANELRLMLCREKFTAGKKGTSVIAACGIFVNDIIDAVPIDKYFELFKPHAGGEGGYIRICMDFAKDPSELEKHGQSTVTAIPEEPAAAPALAAKPSSTAEAETQKKKKKKGARLTLLLVAAAGAVAGGVFGIVRATRPKKSTWI